MECLKGVSGHTSSKYFTSEKFRSVYKLSTIAYFYGTIGSVSWRNWIKPGLSWVMMC